MKKKRVRIEELLATYSSHVSSNYRSPDEFQWNLDRLLKGKKSRFGNESYSDSLEKNMVFLHDLVLEGEALLDMLFRSGSSKGHVEVTEIDELLREMEQKLWDQTEERHREVFGEGRDPEFTDLYKMKQTGDPAFVDKLEFNYRYLMALRILLFEFFNVLSSVESEYHIVGTGPATSRDVLTHIKLTANYYLGNVQVGSNASGNEALN